MKKILALLLSFITIITLLLPVLAAGETPEISITWLSTQYNSLVSADAGLMRVSKQDAEGNYKYGFIDASGQVVIPIEYDYAYTFSEGLAAVENVDALGYTKYGFINTSGQVIAALNYDGAYTFSGGMAAVKKKTRVGTPCGVLSTLLDK